MPVFESAFVSIFEFPFPDSVSLSSSLFVSEFVLAPFVIHTFGFSQGGDGGAFLFLLAGAII